TRKGRADCKIVGNQLHIFVFQQNTSQLISLQYTPALTTFEPWSPRPSLVQFSFNGEVQTATIDIDGTGRMWMAYVRNSNVIVRWSDAPYSNWSEQLSLDPGVRSDDVATVVALPGKIGVLWSNQNTERFGFKTHMDGALPSVWSSDE